jgi:hypothetical protein
MAALAGLAGGDFRSLPRDLAAILVLVQRREHPSEFDGVGYPMTLSCLRRGIKQSKFLQLSCESLKLVQIL